MSSPASGGVPQQVVVVGAGVGGLAAASSLAKAGVPVTVLEAHVYPGGCAGTFYYQGYRFDAGATLAGGFAPGAPMDLLARALELQWPLLEPGATPAEGPGHAAEEPADGLVMAVHLPDGTRVERWADGSRWESARVAAFGQEAEPFWRWQEATADRLWPFAQALPPWPPQSATDTLALAALGLRHTLLPLRDLLALPGQAADLARTVSAHLPPGNPRLRQYVDGQLLIAAQAQSDRAGALFGAAALDLPRRGVGHLAGGMGAIAQTLAAAVQRDGGTVRYRQEVTRVVLERGLPVAVETRRGDSFPASAVLLNLPPPNAAALLGDSAPPRLRRLAHRPPWPDDGWGAFTLYLGLDGSAVPAGTPLHHQVLSAPPGAPLAEGRSVFLSLSPEADPSRAPAGRRAATLSTHTAPAPWWQLHRTDPDGYRRRVEAYTTRLLDAAGRALPGALPGVRDAVLLALPGTPVTFQRYTRRLGGWVGGFPQTGLLRTWGPHLSPGVWLVGDSVFPGQSTAAVALGGLRVAQAVLRALG